jgi:hypothetical protein
VLVAAEVAWFAGGTAARGSLESKGHAGAAGLLVCICGFVALFAFFRRWGTAGNVMYTARMSGRTIPRRSRR